MKKMLLIASALLFASCSQNVPVPDQQVALQSTGLTVEPTPEETEFTGSKGEFPLQVQSYDVVLENTKNPTFNDPDDNQTNAVAACYDVNGNGVCDDFRNSTVRARRTGGGAQNGERVYVQKHVCRISTPCKITMQDSKSGTISVSVNGEYKGAIASAGVTVTGSYTWTTQVGSEVTLQPNTCAEYRVLMDYEVTRGDYNADFYEGGWAGTYGGRFIGRFNIPGKNWTVKKPVRETKGWWTVRC